MKLSARTLRILKGETPLPLYFFILAPLCLIYSAVLRLRAVLYLVGALKIRKLPCKVVSVGNLTAGGTGKTPFVIYIAGLLAEMGLKAAVVTRGYGGSAEGTIMVVSDERRVLLGPSEAGDEAVLLARSLPGTPVVMGSDRYRAGLKTRDRFGPDVIILDDGYQHMVLHRDLNILLLDAAHPFGNGFTLPMGYLREPKSAVKRADIAVLTRVERAQGEPMVQGLQPNVPVIKAAYRPRSLHGVWDKAEMGLEGLSGKTVLAVSGIADPGSFTLILQKLNAKITGTIEYPDHYGYTPEDIVSIGAEAARMGAEMVVVTEKDAVKLSRLTPGPCPFLALGIEMDITEGAEPLRELIKKRIV